MDFPVILQAFGCARLGLGTPLEFDPLAVDPMVIGNTAYLSDSMPLTTVPEDVDKSLQELIEQDYEPQLAHVSFVEAPQQAVRDWSDQSAQVVFTEYWLTHDSPDPQPVFALTTGHLFYLHNGMSYSKLLSGAAPNLNEEILVLVPLQQGITSWRESLPGTIPVPVQAAYLNIQMVDDSALKDLINKTTTEEFFKTQYKSKMHTDWLGPTETESDWQTAYLNKFKEYPDWPILVKGGAQIGTTRTSPDVPLEQRLSMFLRIGTSWRGSNNEVKDFFDYYQRRLNLCGHPLAAALLGRSVKSSSVDVISFQYQQPSETSYIPRIQNLRSKSLLEKDFRKYAASASPLYHPLALDPDQSPHRLIVRRRTPVELIPPYLNPILGQTSAWSTKLLIQNPFELPVLITSSLSEGITISPVSFDSMSQTIEITADENLPPATTEATIEIITEDGTENRSIARELTLTFMDFHAVPVKFFKMIDSQGLYQTEMDEAKLREVIAYANEILGRQANVYMYPVEALVDQMPRILHDTTIFANTGFPLPVSEIEQYSEDFFVLYRPEYRNYINVIFVWNQAATGENTGVTDYPYDTQLALIYIDTQGTDGSLLDVGVMADTLVHELGHWFAHTFSRVPNRESNPSLPDCTGAFIHFNHDGNDYEGCAGGNWSLYGNLMTQRGGANVFITHEQANLFSDYAIRVFSSTLTGR